MGIYHTIMANQDAPNEIFLLAFLNILVYLHPDLLVNVFGGRNKKGFGNLFVHNVLAVEGFFTTLTADGAVSKDRQNPKHPQENTDTTAKNKCHCTTFPGAK